MSLGNDGMEFENGDIAHIVSDSKGVRVVIDDSELGEITISGFPTEVDAKQFLLFGDWVNPNDNDFINITNPSYSLDWHFATEE
jgi:hypothetical protein